MDVKAQDRNSVAVTEVSLANSESILNIGKFFNDEIIFNLINQYSS
jgi:hypothetical protein